MNLSTQLLVAKKWLKIVIITVYSTCFKLKNKIFLFLSFYLKINHFIGVLLQSYELKGYV